jgi:parvulin-like peptidyl-prolyl isomerase
MYKPGQISGVVKSGFGYHLVKFMGKRQLSFDSVEDKIYNMLFQKNMQDQFHKWVQQKRMRSDIKIYMDNYSRG